MTVYATAEDLTARLSPDYESLPAEDVLIVLTKASEVIDEATLGRAAKAWADDSDLSLGYRDTLTRATCDQVEFWLEVGEEHDVSGLKGSLVSGRLQIHPVPLRLSHRARRTLMLGGLFYRGVNVR